MGSQQGEGAGNGVVEPIDCRLRVEQHNASAEVKHQREDPVAASAEEEGVSVIGYLNICWHLQLLWCAQLQQQAERDQNHNAAELRWIWQLNAMSAKEIG